MGPQVFSRAKCYVAHSKEVVGTIRQKLTPRIRCTKHPKLNWTNIQCREWLADVLVVHCQRNLDAAKILASVIFYSGSGMMMMQLSKEELKRVLGYEDGLLVNAVLGKARVRIGWDRELVREPAFRARVQVDYHQVHVEVVEICGSDLEKEVEDDGVFM